MERNSFYLGTLWSMIHLKTGSMGTSANCFIDPGCHCEIWNDLKIMATILTSRFWRVHPIFFGQRAPIFLPFTQTPVGLFIGFYRWTQQNKSHLKIKGRPPNIIHQSTNQTTLKKVFLDFSGPKKKPCQNAGRSPCSRKCDWWFATWAIKKSLVGI